MRTFFALLLCCFCFQNGFAQLLESKKEFTRADTLRGSLLPERTWFDVTFYDLYLTLNPSAKAIENAHNTIFFTVKNNQTSIMQLDLFANLKTDSIVFEGKKLEYKREYNAVFITMPKNLAIGKNYALTFYYSGNPTVAKRAPWDGGFVFTKDKNQTAWVGVACQGMGASVWYPNKDHQSDEPDSMRISCAVPQNLTCVANGVLKNVYPDKQKPDYKRFEWFVSYPINNYAASLNIGDYTHFADTFTYKNYKPLTLNYYVLSYNVEKARKQFEQVKPMMNCYYEYFGEYPFVNDGYALVETPYLGMEHQSAIAYGNNYQTGYAGTDYSGIGLTFDYIIIHETGHEWWGNSVTTPDIADMWIHEGFCTYGEALYVECMHGYKTAIKYLEAQQRGVDNKEAIIGQYNVNKEGSGDMYPKGSLLLNTIRSVIKNDDLWFSIIKGIQKDFKYKIVTSKTITDYINTKAGNNFDKIWKQYLEYPNLPMLEYKTAKKGKNLTLQYRWKTDVQGFDMPIEYTDPEGKLQRLQPTNEWKTILLKKVPKNYELQFATDLFYIQTQKM